jgi:uncharacterized protein (TIGR02147 family)
MDNDAKLAVLNQEFERRKRLNSSYSSRAFARDLAISHTYLSLLKSGKREFTAKLCAKLLPHLKLTKKDSLLFKQEIKAEQDVEREKISIAQFSMISDWPFYAVLSLLQVPDFKWDDEWIADRLGVSKARAQLIMKVLTHSDMVEEVNGRYKQKPKPIVVENKNPSQSARSFNRRLIQKALESIDNTAFHERDVSSIVFAMDPSLVEYAIERIRNFRRSLSRELEMLGEPQEAYALSVQLFPLSKKRTKK